MLTLLTSCNRPDLLDQTLKSLLENQKEKISLVITEDGLEKEGAEKSEILKVCHKYRANMAMLEITGKVGQHAAIEKFLKHGCTDKYYLHLEDDWEFNNSYNWIHESIKIMNASPKTIKVLARENSPHPCVHNHIIKGQTIGPSIGGPKNRFFGYVEPWESADNILWHGFSWNPGVTRLDILKSLMPFPKWEQELAKIIHEAGYKVAELEDSVYRHIGDGRSTHE
jgi:hypothetical protein